MIVTLMEENNDIFLAGGDAQMYLAKAMLKNISQNFFGAISLVRTFLMTDFSTHLPLYALAHILDDPSPFPQLRTYLMDGLSSTKNK